jgi:hypothetical protein
VGIAQTKRISLTGMFQTTVSNTSTYSLIKNEAASFCCSQICKMNLLPLAPVWPSQHVRCSTQANSTVQAKL